MTIKVNHKNYYQFIDQYCQQFPGKVALSGWDTELTVENFQAVSHTKQAQTVRNIVYLWHTEKPIPRLKGHSPIIYIGQTEKSFFNRHGGSKIKVTSKANKQKYNDLVRYYGPIRVSYLERAVFFPNVSLAQMEGQLLWWYFQNHSEYPPINYTKTKIRTDDFVFNLPDSFNEIGG